MTQHEPLKIAKKLLLHRGKQVTAMQSNILARRCDIDWLQHAPLFDVCVAMSALYIYRARAISGAQWAILAKRLIAAELKPGGPYLDIGAGKPTMALNIAVAFLFHSIGKPLPLLEQFVKTHTSKDGTADSMEPFLHDLAMRLTTTTIQQTASTSQKFPARIPTYNHIKTKLLTQPTLIRSALTGVLQRVQNADKHNEISQLAAHFNKSLIHPIGSRVLIQQLSKANIYCWMAYMLYDDILDTNNNLELLPAATISMRHAYQYYYQAAHTKDSRELVQSAFEHADYANAWELAFARAPHSLTKITIQQLPDYGDNTILAMRSEPHILGPLIIISQTSATSMHTPQFLAGWQHYLIAKQLSDDIHDWQDDIQNGQLSFVVCHILQQAGIKPGTYTYDELIATMQQTFWETSMYAISTLILEHITIARSAFAKTNLLQDKGTIYAFLDKITVETQNALKKRHAYEQFLHSYTKNTHSTQ